jgi:hypothetical protein
MSADMNPLKGAIGPAGDRPSPTVNPGSHAVHQSQVTNLGLFSLELISYFRGN